MVDGTVKTIGGFQVRVVPLLGTRSFLVKAKLIRYFGKSLVKAIGAVKEMKGKSKSVMAMDIDFNMFSDAITDLASHDPEALLAFIMEALQTTYINEQSAGDKATFDMQFAKHMVLMYKILWFTLEENYGDFFEAVGIGNTKKAG